MSFLACNYNVSEIGVLVGYDRQRKRRSVFVRIFCKNKLAVCGITGYFAVFKAVNRAVAAYVEIFYPAKLYGGIISVRLIYAVAL